MNPAAVQTGLRRFRYWCRRAAADSGHAIVSAFDWRPILAASAATAACCPIRDWRLHMVLTARTAAAAKDFGEATEAFAEVPGSITVRAFACQARKQHAVGMPRQNPFFLQLANLLADREQIIEDLNKVYSTLYPLDRIKTPTVVAYTAIPE